VKNETYYICSAKTEYKAEGTLLNWFFVLTINLFPKRVSQKTYRAREFGILGKKYVEFDWHSREIRIVSGESLVAQDLGFEEYKYRVYSPILPNGASIIGNPEKFATFNLQQFKDLLSTNTITKLTLELVKDEETPIFVCLPSDEEFEIDVNGKKLAPNKEISGEGLTVNWTILSKFTNFGVEINKLSLISKTNLKISVEIENKIKKI